MRTLIVPTDFSDNANNALAYAIEFASKARYKIVLLHSDEMDYQTLLYTLVVPATETIRREAKKLLEETGLRIKRAGNIRYECVIDDSPLVDAILKTVETKKADMIIMGTKGAHGLKKFIAGSNTATIIEKAKCPVIAVPEGVKFKGIHRLTYATNYEQSDLRILKKLAQIAKPFMAQINVLHLYSHNEKKDHLEKQGMLQFLKKVTQKVLYNNISFQLLEGDDLEQRFDDYLHSSTTDLLVMCTHQRNLIDKLFDKSLTKELSYHINLPLLVFHHSKTPLVF